MPNTQASMNPRTIRYLREQLRFAVLDLDAALQVPPGTIAAAEEGKIELDQKTVLRLRHMVNAVAMSGLMPDRRHLGMCIRQARVALGKTQKEVAMGCGMGQAQYARIEQTKNPTHQSVCAIAKALGVPPAWIYGAKPLTDNMDYGIIPTSSDSPQKTPEK